MSKMESPDACGVADVVQGEARVTLEMILVTCDQLPESWFASRRERQERAGCPAGCLFGFAGHLDPRRFFEHGVRIGSSDSERADAGDTAAIGLAERSP